MVLPANSVFISYRKDDSAGWSAKLAADLRTLLGERAVFIDDSTGIPLGTPWPDQIAVALNQCRVFLPVIAPSWHQASNLIRLKEPGDWVRWELTTTHDRRSSVLSIPVFVNEAPVLNPEQFADDPELKTVIAHLMNDQGIKLDRGTEFWPAKIDSLIARIEAHLGMEIPRTDGGLPANNAESPDSRSPPPSPVIRWLSANATWLGTVGAIAAVVGLAPMFFGSSPDSNGNTVTLGEGNQVGVVAGGDVTMGNPQDKETITSQQRTIELLTSQLSAREQQANPQIRGDVADAVTGISETDSTPTQIAQAEAALADGNTQLAQALYKADAEKKAAAGEAKLQAAAESYRRLGALAFLGDTTAAVAAYEQAVKLWPGDIRAWNQLGHLYVRTGQLDQAIEAYGQVAALADSTDDPQRWTAISLGNLGGVHHTRGELDQAVAMYEQSLAIDTELGRKEGMASDYGNLGIIHGTRGELDQAVALFEQSLAIETELGRKQGMASDYGNLGNVHQIRGELDQAVTMYEKSLAIEIELGNKEGMANAYGNLGIVHQIRGELDQARESWQRSLQLFQEIGSPTAMQVQAWIDGLDAG